MNKKINILTSLLVLGFSFMTSDIALGANSLVQMDIKKANQDTVDFTLYTSETAKDNVIVRKKSDNKYVVLVPGVSSAMTKPDFYSVKDVITNIDVKSVADTADGYTKMTVITKKPLNIRTKTVKSGPITAEQKEYRSLLAVANTPKLDNIKPVAKTETLKTEVQKPVTPQVKTSAVSEIITPEVLNLKKLELLSNPSTPQPKVETSAKVSEPIVEVSKTKVKTNKKEQTERKSFVKELQNDVLQNDDTELAMNVPTLDNETNVNHNKTSFKTKVKEKWNNQIYPWITSKISANPTWVMILCPLLFLLFMFRLIKKSVEKSRDLRAAFVNKVKGESTHITKKYTDITGDETLSWREKYQRYNDAVQNPEKYNQEKLERARQKYAFIKNINSVEEKRQSLESMVAQNEVQTFGGVSSETDVINNQMKKVHLKGFATNPSLRATSRNKMRDSIEQIQGNYNQNVQPNVELNNSILNQSVRNFSDANLNLSDVEEKTKSLKELKRMEELRKKDYEMSSLEEFFSIPEPLVSEVQEKPIKMISTPKKSSSEFASENLQKLEPTMRMPRPYQAASGINLSKAFANPFNKKDGTIKMISTPKPQKSPIDEIKVSSHYEIDENRGFMMVSLDGKSALIGKVNDEITVLKEFNHIVEQQLQVRKDKENVYMVKIEDFKSLIEIGESKMGVLIEL